ncbi:MAG: hypothetical protein M1823_005922 [Watsoniomyces obsoletus]|nr:MAG: hypothetical protein M1823_005922 [Watsoniomyces obsoletus]
MAGFDTSSVSEPFPIFLVAGRYMLYDINVITHLRRQHHICGVLIGSLPQLPQQNVFLGIPLQLMPEEARLLVDKGVSFIVDDIAHHKRGIKNLSDEQRLDFLSILEKQGKELAINSAKLAEKKKTDALNRFKAKGNRPQSQVAKEDGESDVAGHQEEAREHDNGHDELFNSSQQELSARMDTSSSNGDLEAFKITPTTSSALLPVRSRPSQSSVPKVPPSYPLFAHLHDKGYYLSPGLRFGCQYLVYPGDPLRFHSHFLAVSADWDEEIDLIDIIAGGRLGTGVKKGFLIGGVEDQVHQENDKRTLDAAASVRTFCIEWGGM